MSISALCAANAIISFIPAGATEIAIPSVRLASNTILARNWIESKVSINNSFTRSISAPARRKNAAASKVRAPVC